MSEKSVADREREKAMEMDRELFIELAMRAEGAKTIEFARVALNGLMAMGLDPAAPVFSDRIAAVYGKDKVNFLQLASAFPTPGCPMLKAVLEQGVRPEEGCEPEGLTPLMNAAMYENAEAAILLSEAGASWTWRMGRKGWPKAGMLGQSPAEKLLGSEPRGSRRMSKEERAKDGALWEKACGLAIGALKGKSASAGLAALILGDCDIKPIRKRLMERLKQAGGSPTALVSGCQETNWASSAATPVWLAAHLSGQGDPEPLFETLETFPEAAEPESMSSLLAATGMGLRSASENGELRAAEPWMPAKKIQRLAEELAPSDPLATIKIKGEERGPSFAAALGGLCVAEACSSKAFKEIKGFWGLWLAEARAIGATLETRAIAEELGRGGGSASALTDSKGRPLSWPKREDLAQAKERSAELLGADAELAGQGSAWAAAWLSKWATEADERGPGPGRGARSKKGFEEFAEALSEELELAEAAGVQGLSGAWGAVESAASRAAGEFSEKSLARVERVAALAATRGGSGERPKAKAKARI